MDISVTCEILYFKLKTPKVGNSKRVGKVGISEVSIVQQKIISGLVQYFFVKLSRTILI